MRYLVLLVGVTVVGAVMTGLLFPANKHASPPSDLSPSVGGATVVGVEALMNPPEDYSGPVQVEGVVSAISAERKILALIDRRELKECGVTTCAALTLPVRWDGPMPAVRDVVLLQGEIKDSRGRLIFVASSLTPLPRDNSDGDSR